MKYFYTQLLPYPTLGVLGKKWTMLIPRDIGLFKIVRFNRILKSIPGLTPEDISNVAVNIWNSQQYRYAIAIR